VLAMSSLRRLALLAALVAAATLISAGNAWSASGVWDRAWGQSVNGGGAFGICTVAENCLAGTSGGLGVGGEMVAPRGVATDAAGNVYVADTNNNRIQKFDSSGNWERAWGKNVNGGGVFGICTVAASCRAGITGGLGGEMYDPAGVAVDAAGNVYVADLTNNRIQKFDSSGNFLRAWGRGVNGGTAFGICTVAANCHAGTGGGLGGEMFFPDGIATDTAGNVYLADTNNNRIQKFDSAGNWQRAWGNNVNGGFVFGICTVAANCQAGATGGLGGEMFFPDGIATDRVGNVYVADTDNHRVQKFDSAGTWQRAWGKGVNGGTPLGVCAVAASCQAGTSGGLGGEMNYPSGVTTDAAGDVYLADQLNHRIQKFDSSGNFLRAWGKNVNGGGTFGICTVAASCLAGTTGGLGGEMNYPFGVATDAAGSLYVSDYLNERIQKFADPPPPLGPGSSTTGTGSAPNPRCQLLRKKLKKAKKAHKRAKVRKLRRKLRRLGC
jgi:sugar lactone lactonase YvrE